MGGGAREPEGDTPAKRGGIEREKVIPERETKHHSSGIMRQQSEANTTTKTGLV